MRLPRVRRLGLRARLNLLVALCVLPALLLILGIDILDYRRARAVQEEETLNQARGIAETVGRVLQAETAALQTLSLSHSLRTDLTTFASQGTQFVRWRHGPAALRLDAPDGRSLLISPLPTGGIAPTTLRRVFTTGRPLIGGYSATALDGRPGFCINVPVEDAGSVRWNLRLVLGVDRLSGILAGQTVHAGWGLALVDNTDQLLAHRPAVAPWPGTEISPALKRAIRAAPEGFTNGRRGDGTALRIIWATVPGHSFHGRPWLVLVGVPRIAEMLPLYRTAGATVFASLAALLAGLLLAGAVARRISNPIARLQALAASPVTAATGPPPPTGLPETDAVATVLHQTAAAHRDALGRLQALAGTLESRVAEEVAARQMAQDRAAQGERLQALGRLASGIAHDFNNVLQAVNTASEVLARTSDPTAVQRMAQVLGHAARQGAAITGRLLGFARRDAAPRLAPLDLPPLLADLHAMLAATLGSRVRVTVALPDGLPRVLADAAQLETVLINLAANARDAMPQGGEVRLAARLALPASPDRPPRLPPASYVVLAVTDTGTGMSQAVLARVTEPFFSTKPAGRGTGLGLALARGFAEQCGGALRIDSTEGQGTTVALWLRVAEAAQMQVAESVG